MPGWGSAFKTAWDGATDAARRKAQAAMASARAAADAVVQGGKKAVQATAAAVDAGVDAVGRAASAAKDKAVGAAAAAAKAGKNIVGFGGRALGEAGGTGASLATAPYRVVRQQFSPTRPPSPIQPCPASTEAKIDRLEQRNSEIRAGRRSQDPHKRQAADRLARNNEAVELARLSDNAYAQYPGPEFTYPTGTDSPAPTGWSVVPAAELESRGVSVKDLEAARAVVYRTPETWPGGQKTVLSFRGTADLEDGIVDHDQAMGLPTDQYKSAMQVGDAMSNGFGTSVVVTGHSLGGGMAQAAGAAGGLQGTMFNSAGLNPETTGGLMTQANQFSQYRTAGDPLTGAQNSALAQSAIAAVAGVVAMPLGLGMKVGDAAQKALGSPGLTPEQADYADKAFKAFPRGVKNLVQRGDVLPPAIGPVHEVQALDSDGQAVSRLDLGGQHSIVSVVNGIEREKEDDLATLAA